MLQIFTISGCRFRCFDEMISIVLLLLVVGLLRRLLLMLVWRLLLGRGVRTRLLMIVQGCSTSILQLRLLVDGWMSLLLRYGHRRLLLFLWLNMVGHVLLMLLVVLYSRGTIQIIIIVYHILMRLLL